MLERVLRVLTEECQVSANTGLLVGVSGGPDSLCLLDILHRLKFKLVVAHFDHGLRVESGDDACFVKSFAEERGLPFASRREDVAGYAVQQRCSIEEAARILRYRFLFQQARALKMGAVAIAHTADDQVETVLLHLLRGTGIDGLCGMNYRSILPVWDAEIPLIRPLLDFWREDVLQYCQQQGLQPLQDASNQSILFTRNRIRLQLIPQMVQFNPQVRKALHRMSAILRGDAGIIQAWLNDTWQRCLVREGKGFLELSIPSVQQLTYQAKFSFLRYVILKLKPEITDLSYEVVHRVTAFTEEPRTGKVIEVMAGIVLRREGDRFIFHDTAYEMPLEDYPQILTECQVLDCPGSIRLSDGWQIVAEIENNIPSGWDQPRNMHHFHAWLDAETCRFPLTIRPARRGERMQPLGLAGKSVKISDLLINRKLPKRWRSGYPGWRILSGTGRLR